MMRGLLTSIAVSIICVCAIIATVGCEGDGSSSSSNPIAATWVIQTANGETIPEEERDSVTLNSDGSGTYTSPSEGVADSFTWSTSGATLTVTDEEGTESMQFQISGSTMTITDPDGTVITWSKA